MSQYYLYYFEYNKYSNLFAFGKIWPIGAGLAFYPNDPHDGAPATFGVTFGENFQLFIIYKSKTEWKYTV